jgi:hypothetical protein
MRTFTSLAALIVAASCVTTGAGAGGRASGATIRQIVECQGKMSRAGEHLRIARLTGHHIADKADAELIVESSTLTIRSRSVPGAFIFLAREETESEGGGMWRPACDAPGAADNVAGNDDLYQSCLRDAAIIKCLEDLQGWTRIAERPGMISPPQSIQH